MGQEMFLRKIPEDMRPWECNVNGVKYVYPAGTEQNVPAEVAALIDAYWEKQEVDYPETGISFNDLRDRPFGESTEVLFDQRVEIEAGEGNVFQYALPISAGDSVKVTWNGAEYECTAGTGSNNLVFFGNPAIMGGEDNGIPFIMATGTFNGDGIFGIIAPDFIGQTVSVKVEGLVVKTIDPKFIPAGVGGGVVIVQDSAKASGVAVVDGDATATMNAAEIAEAVQAGKTVYFLTLAELLLPLAQVHLYHELVSGAMAVIEQPNPYVQFGTMNEDGSYMCVKVWPDGSYTELYSE